MSRLWDRLPIRGVLVLVAWAGVPAAAEAQTTAAIVAPSTQPTSRPAARLTPVACLVSHAIAMTGGDAAGVRASYSAATAAEQKVVDAYANMAQAMARLRQSAQDRFGPDGFAAIGFDSLYDQEIGRLQAARQELHGNWAVVYVPNSGHAGPAATQLILVKADGEWKISVGQSYKNGLEHRAARINAQAQAYGQLADEIAAGQYKVALQARAAGKEKVRAAMHKAEEQFADPATRESR